MSPVAPPITRTDFGAVKTAIHRKLIQKLNLDRLTEINREEVRREVGHILEALVVSESTPMNLQERERLAQEVLDEVFGLGPLEPLLADPTVSDILVTPKNICSITSRTLGAASAFPKKASGPCTYRSSAF